MEQQFEAVSEFPLTFPPVCWLLFMYASRTDGGTHLQELTGSSAWTEDETNMHIIIITEMRLILLILYAFQECFLGHMVGLMSDWATVVVEGVCCLFPFAYWWCMPCPHIAELYFMELITRFIPGKRNVMTE